MWNCFIRNSHKHFLKRMLFIVGKFSLIGISLKNNLTLKGMHFVYVFPPFLLKLLIAKEEYIYI